jgi:TPR repeat protein
MRLEDIASEFRGAALGNQGDVTAYRELGLSYTSGEGVSYDFVQAYKWWSLAISRHDSEPSVPELFGELKEAMSKEQIVEGERLAAAWPSELARNQIKAATAGNRTAQLNLGFAYLSGYGVPQDEAEASKWFAKAAEHGNSYASVMLASAYINGKGVPQDRPQAYKWLMVSMKVGNADPQVQKMFRSLETQMSAKEVEDGERLVAQWQAEHPATTPPAGH